MLRRDGSPFSSVMKSARCSARTSEKRPALEDSRIFCLSCAGGIVSGARRRPLVPCTVTVEGFADVHGGVTSPAALDAAPLAAATLLRLDMAAVVSTFRRFFVSSLEAAYFL